MLCTEAERGHRVPMLHFSVSELIPRRAVTVPMKRSQNETGRLPVDNDTEQ